MTQICSSRPQWLCSDFFWWSSTFFIKFSIYINFHWQKYCLVLCIRTIYTWWCPSGKCQQGIISYNIIPTLQYFLAPTQECLRQHFVISFHIIPANAPASNANRASGSIINPRFQYFQAPAHEWLHQHFCYRSLAFTDFGSLTELINNSTNASHDASFYIIKIVEIHTSGQKMSSIFVLVARPLGNIVGIGARMPGWALITKLTQPVNELRTGWFLTIEATPLTCLVPYQSNFVNTSLKWV